jgi:hypothetical protein
MNNALIRLTERFCEEKRMDVADDVRKNLSSLVYQYLKLFDEGIDNRELWRVAGMRARGRIQFAEEMTDGILKFIRQHNEPPQTPYPD